MKTNTLMPGENTSPDRQEMKLVPSKVWIWGSVFGCAAGSVGLAMVAQQNCEGYRNLIKEQMSLLTSN